MRAADRRPRAGPIALAAGQPPGDVDPGINTGSIQAAITRTDMRDRQRMLPPIFEASAGSDVSTGAVADRIAALAPQRRWDPPAVAAEIRTLDRAGAP